MTASARPIVVASNRGPVAHDLEPDGSLTPQRGAGGLVTALAGALLEQEAVWLAAAMTPGDREAAARGGGDDSMRYVVVPEERYRRYYDEVSNRLLWFVHHYLWDIVRTPDLRRRDDGRLGRLRDREPHVRRGPGRPAPRCGDPGPGLPPRDGPADGARAPPGRGDLALLAHAVRRPHVPADPAHADARGAPARDARGGRLRVPVGRLGRQLPDVVPHAAGRPRRPAAPARPLRGTGDARPRLSDLGGGRPAAGGRRHSRESAGARLDLERWRGDAKLLLRVDRLELTKNILRGFLAYEAFLRSSPEWQGRVRFLAML